MEETNQVHHPHSPPDGTEDVATPPITSGGGGGDGGVGKDEVVVGKDENEEASLPDPPVVTTQSPIPQDDTQKEESGGVIPSLVQPLVMVVASTSKPPAILLSTNTNGHGGITKTTVATRTTTSTTTNTTRSDPLLASKKDALVPSKKQVLVASKKDAKEKDQGNDQGAKPSRSIPRGDEKVRFSHRKSRRRDTANDDDDDDDYDDDNKNGPGDDDRLMAPGAISIGGARRRLDNNEHEEEVEAEVEEDLSTFPTIVGSIPTDVIGVIDPSMDHPQIDAFLAPDDEAEVEARIAQMLEERLRLEQMEGQVVVEAEIKEDLSTFCGLQRRTLWILTILLLAVIGGIVYAVVNSLSGNNDGTSSATITTVVASKEDLVTELTLMNAISDDDLALFDDPTSVQSQALAWLSNDTIATAQDHSPRDVLQRYVLAVLYFATSGPNWTSPYLSSDSVCTWNLGGTRDYSKQGVYCWNDGLSIDYLILRVNNLQGQLPWELVLLTNLERISLSQNLLTGTIPTRISELTRLQLFDVNSNRISGPLPTSLSSRTFQIDLFHNNFNGTIPQTWGTSMPGLKKVGLNGNELTGPLPATLGLLSSLTYLQIAENQLTGTIPSELAGINSLLTFNFSANLFTGSVNDFFCVEERKTLWLSADCDAVDCSCCYCF